LELNLTEANLDVDTDVMVKFDEDKTWLAVQAVGHTSAVLLMLHVNKQFDEQYLGDRKALQFIDYFDVYEMTPKASLSFELRVGRPLRADMQGLILHAIEDSKHCQFLLNASQGPTSLNSSLGRNSALGLKFVAFEAKMLLMIEGNLSSLKGAAKDQSPVQTTSYEPFNRV